jgi:hypothetical protein
VEAVLHASSTGREGWAVAVDAASDADVAVRLERVSADTRDEGRMSEAVLAATAVPGDTVAARTLAAARGLAVADPSAAADLGRRALGLLPDADDRRGPLVAETVTRVHRAMRLGEARSLGEAALLTLLPPDQEARVRLSLSRLASSSTAARIAHNRLALATPGVAVSTRNRHRAWLAYNLMMHGAAAEAAMQARRALAEAADPAGRLLSLVVAGGVAAGRGDVRAVAGAGVRMTLG